MDFPPDWESGVSASDNRGHQDGGRTIAIHSIAILPQFQGSGLGTTICKAYTQRMETAGISDRIALLAHDRLVGFYQKAGYEHKGKSDVRFGGGGWNDMACLILAFTVGVSLCDIEKLTCAPRSMNSPITFLVCSLLHIRTDTEQSDKLTVCCA